MKDASSKGKTQLREIRVFLGGTAEREAEILAQRRKVKPCPKCGNEMQEEDSDYYGHSTYWWECPNCGYIDEEKVKP